MNSEWVLWLYSAKKRAWVSWLKGSLQEVLEDALMWANGTGVPREAYPAIRIEVQSEHYEEPT